MHCERSHWSHIRNFDKDRDCETLSIRLVFQDLDCSVFSMNSLIKGEGSISLLTLENRGIGVRTQKLIVNVGCKTIVSTN